MMHGSIDPCDYTRLPEHRFEDDRHRELWYVLREMHTDGEFLTLENVMTYMKDYRTPAVPLTLDFVRAIISGTPKPIDLPALDFDELPF